MDIVKGYKAFESDWTCRGKQYTCPGVFEDCAPEDLKICSKGIHFCEKPIDCFAFYNFSEQTKIAEVEALGRTLSNGTKTCTNKIRIIREVPWSEVLKLVNTGKDNSGNRNSGNCNSGNCNSGNRNSGDWNSGDWNSGNRNNGDCNSGNRNSGDWNSGNRNSGNRNSGDWNSGDWNRGDWNSGNWNSGDWNSGNRNSGDWNSGNRNSGDWNSGDWNSGNRNSGNRNSGDWNSGNRNSGDRNSGDWNSGDWNSGNRNSGNRNSGDWNSGDWNSGCFNTETPKILLFNKPSEWTIYDWDESFAYRVMSNAPSGEEWILYSDMTDKERDAHPEAKAQQGYLQSLDYEDLVAERNKWWHKLSDEDKQAVLSLPNFDADIFRECTLIEVDKEDDSETL